VIGDLTYDIHLFPRWKDVSWVEEFGQNYREIAATRIDVLSPFLYYDDFDLPMSQVSHMIDYTYLEAAGNAEFIPEFDDDYTEGTYVVLFRDYVDWDRIEGINFLAHSPLTPQKVKNFTRGLDRAGVIWRERRQ